VLRYRKLIGSLYESWTIGIEKTNVCSTKSIGETKLKRNSGSELCKTDKTVYGFFKRWLSGKWQYKKGKDNDYKLILQIILTFFICYLIKYCTFAAQFKQVFFIE